jgi:hypothetical protein
MAQGVGYVPVINRFGLYCEHQPEVSMLGTIILVILVLFLIGMLPTWPHSREWGYGPSSGVGLVVVVLLVLVLTGRL